MPAERRFVGFDAFERAIDEDVDVVTLTTPPGFRPQHFAHAVERGLKVGVGLQRHDRRYQETVRLLREGAIGEPVLLRVYWNGAGVWVRPRTPEMTEMEYQMRNWYYFNWLCGDHIVEQHIHNLDVGNWILGAVPVEAQGQGGREVRDGRDHGEIFDHHMVEFTYANGTKMLSQCRHQPGCWQSVSEHAHGTAGTADVSGGVVRSEDREWAFAGLDLPNPNAYQVEHDRLFAAIRADEPHAEAENGAHATLTAILGRMATYSGQRVTWDQALSSELALVPERYAFDAAPPTVPAADGRYPSPEPGVTRAF